MNVRANNLPARHRPRFQFDGLTVTHVESGLTLPVRRLTHAASMARAYEDMGRWIGQMASSMLIQCCDVTADLPPARQYNELRQLSLRYRRLANVLHEIGV